MNVYVGYVLVILGISAITLAISYFTGINHRRRRAVTAAVVAVPAVPASDGGDGYVRSDYPAERQSFLNDLDNKDIENMPNTGDDYMDEKERRDVNAFSVYCDAGMAKISGAGDS
jgi:hypothetical protein